MPDAPETNLAPSRPLRRAMRWGLRILPVVLLVAAAWVLWGEFHKLSLQAVLHAIAGWGVTAVTLAILLSAASFVLMAVIEWVGLRWTGARVPLRTVAAGSFLANAIAHAVGANLLTSDGGLWLQKSSPTLSGQYTQFNNSVTSAVQNITSFAQQFTNIVAQLKAMDDAITQSSSGN